MNERFSLVLVSYSMICIMIKVKKYRLFIERKIIRMFFFNSPGQQCLLLYTQREPSVEIMNAFISSRSLGSR